LNSNQWQNASIYCASNQVYYDVDFSTNTITANFCRPGQYNIFIAPPPPLPANTGNSLNPFPSNSILSGINPTTGVTGSNPIPPPLPVFTVTAGAVSPGQLLVNDASLLSVSYLLIAFIALLI